MIVVSVEMVFRCFQERLPNALSCEIYVSKLLYSGSRAPKRAGHYSRYVGSPRSSASLPGEMLTAARNLN